VADAVRAPRVLCIAGTDPSGGAGLLADTKAVTALGGYAMGVVTAVTVQNTRGVYDVHAVPVDTVIAQLDAVADDVQIDAVKIGMLGEASLVEAVGEWLRRRRPPHVVLDPVMVATTGGRLATDDAARMLRDLVPVVDLVTPNVPELGVLSGVDTAPDIEGIVGQAELVHEQTGSAVLATTGDLLDGSAEDVLVQSTGSAAPRCVCRSFASTRRTRTAPVAHCPRRWRPRGWARRTGRRPIDGSVRGWTVPCTVG